MKLKDQRINDLQSCFSKDLKNFVIISGVEKLKTSIDSKTFESIFDTIKAINGNILLADTQFNFKKYSFDPWYANTVININGIWVGNGFMDQNVIRISDINSKYRQKIDSSFIWVMNNGISCLLKGYLYTGEDL